MAKHDLVNEMKEEGKKSIGGKVIYPHIIDIHPVMNMCNLSCEWCIGEVEKNNDPIFLNYEASKKMIDSIFSADKKEYWPKEIHVCGNNSEPLLNREFIDKLIETIQGKCKLKIITNGILLNQYFEKITQIDKINISLDVVNSEDFCKYKKGKLNDFEKILNNIKKISEIRGVGNKPIMYVSFVIDKLYEEEELIEKFSILKKIGVNHIQLRRNYKESCKSTEIQKMIKNVISRFKMNNLEIDYNVDSFNTFDIKYNEKSCRRNKNENCFSYKLWPAIGANGIVYPCAHTAKQNFTPLLNESILNNNYYDFIDKILSSNNFFRCECSDLCPSNLNYLNTELNSYFNSKYKLKTFKNVFDNDWIEVQLHNINLYGKEINEYCVIKHKNISVVIVVKKDNKLLVTKLYRFITDTLEYELPAGTVEYNETIFEAACREVKEETNINISNLKDIGFFYTSNGISNQKIHVVIAEYGSGDIIPQKDELDNVFWMDIDEILMMIASNKITDGLTINAVLLSNVLEKKKMML